MARPRSFDPDQVLLAAMNVFWTRGYQATSLDHVTEATGVNKPSLYAAFGDKAALFRSALARYHEALLAHARTTLEDATSARDGLRSWLIGFAQACSGEAARGCLSVNASIEAAAADAEVSQQIARYNRALEDLLARTIERAQAAGELRRDLDPRAAARSVLALQTGLLVLGRGAPRLAATRAAMEALLAGLEGDRAPSRGGAAPRRKAARKPRSRRR